MFVMVKIPRNPSDDHEFHTLGSKTFEQFVCELHRYEDGIVSTILYAPEGQKQYGIDHIAFRSDGNIEVGQSKAYKNFPPSKIKETADDFVNHVGTHWQGKKVSKFIIFVGCAVKSKKSCNEIITQVDRFKKLGIDFVLWSSTTIFGRLAGARYVVKTYLGRMFYEHMFGKSGAHLVELTQQIISGNSLAVEAMGIMTRLNQASSAQISELKRRARRGETDAVIACLEGTLRNSAASESLSPENRAEFLRLLAGLLMPRADFPRIKGLLDQADNEHGTSLKLRALLALESVGPEAALLCNDEEGSGVSEVRTVAYLRLAKPDAALSELKRSLEAAAPSAEVLRLASLCELTRGDRNQAVEYARRSVAADSDSRACKTTLGINLFNRALSSAVPPQLGEWPQPIEQSLVHSSISGCKDIEEALAIFASLGSDPSLSDGKMVSAWHFAALACLPERRDEAQGLIAKFEVDGQLTPPMVAWAISRGLRFDADQAAATLDLAGTADPDNLETALVRIALANFRRDKRTAMTLLETIKAVLESSGNAEVYEYWQSLLTAESHSQGANGAVIAHPWLALRSATAIRKKGKRLAAIYEVLNREVDKGGDPAVIVAASQLLLEGNKCRQALIAVPHLINQIGTAEALGLAAHIAYNAGSSDSALAALQKPEAFPNGSLPLNLERIRVDSLATSGHIVDAKRAGLLVAKTTKRAEDAWRAIHLQLVAGDTPAALATYDEHANQLTEPNVGHIHLARALLYTNPHAISRVTQPLWQTTPDQLVPAAFELALRLRLTDQQRQLAPRLHALGLTSSAGVQMVSLDEIAAIMKERRDAAEVAYEKYRHGHLPVHVAAHFLNRSVVGTHLLPHLIEFPSASLSGGTVARYGRRYADEFWPERQSELRLYADVTALLTAHAISFLDRVEECAKPIFVAADILTTLDQLRSSVDVSQPSRLDAMKQVLRALDDGHIKQGEAQQYHAFWEQLPSDANSSNCLNFPKLFEIISSSEDDGSMIDAMRLMLGTTLDAAPEGVSPPAGSPLSMDSGIACTLAEAGALNLAARYFTIAVSQDEIGQMRAEIRGAELGAQLVKSLTALHRKISEGLDLNRYQFVPVRQDQNVADSLVRSIGQLLPAAQQNLGILWVDDRFLTAFPTQELRTMSTVEVIDALLRYDQINLGNKIEFRQKLRNAGWLFMPIASDEMLHLLRESTACGSTGLTDGLNSVATSVALTMAQRRLIQWPNPQELENGAQGEVPHLLDNGHCVSEVLAAIWKDGSWSLDDAGAASQWMLENVDVNLFPLSNIPANDPRSDQMIGIHFGGLMLAGLQILPTKIGRERQKALLQWLWDAHVEETVRTRPDSMSSMIQMIAGHVVARHFEDDEEDLERNLAGNLINALPEPVRAKLLDIGEVRERFEIPRHEVLTIGSYDFDERAFWSAVADCSFEKSVRVNTTDGLAAVIELAGEGESVHINLSAGDDRMRLDAWPKAVCSDNHETRLKALKAETDNLDYSLVQILELNEQLQGLVDPADRVMRTTSCIRRSGVKWYSDFSKAVQDRTPFKVTELVPKAAGDIAQILRIEGEDRNLDKAAERLLADRGLQVAIERFAALPTEVPAPLVSAIDELSPGEAEALIGKVVRNNPKPWVLCFAARLAEALRQPTTGIQDLAKEWIMTAASSGADTIWNLYLKIAQFGCDELVALPDWQGLSVLQRLASCWFHAAEIAQIVIDGQVAVEPFMEILDNHHRASPRIVIEDVAGFAGDAADPRKVHIDRLRLFEIFPQLIKIAENQNCEPERVANEITRLLLDRIDGQDHPKLFVAQNGLATANVLDSIFDRNISDQLENALAGAGILASDGLKRYLLGLLNEAEGSVNFDFAWTMLRLASGDGRLPDDLNSHAGTKAGSLNLVNPQTPPADLRIRLLTVTVLAASNNWAEMRESIDAAMEELYFSTAVDKEIERQFYEQAFWRARTESSSFEIGQRLAGMIERFGRQQPQSEFAQTLLRRLALSLSGRDGEPFIDALAALRLLSSQPSQTGGRAIAA
jgi:hypothetical protein